MKALSRGIIGILAYNGKDWTQFLSSYKFVGEVSYGGRIGNYMPGRPAQS